MKKLLVFVLVVVIAVVAAGAFGAIHDQISYTVSPEYFTKFKFKQFGFSEMAAPERARASLVGFLASWWMGIPIGLLVGAAGFVHRDHRRMLVVSIWSLGVVVGFTLLFGLCGLLYGVCRTSGSAINLADYQGWYIPEDVTDLRHYLRAGYMHNASYLGGVLAIVVAWIFHGIVRARARPPAMQA